MALTENMMLSYPDYTHSGSITNAYPEVGTAAFPSSNVLTADLFSPVVFASNAAQTFVVDLGGVYPINLIAFIAHNIDPYGIVQAVISDDSGVVYDTGEVLAGTVLSDFGTLAWGVFTWGETIAAYQLVNYSQHTYIPLPNTYYGRYIAYTVNSPANATAIYISRVWASAAYQPTFNPDYGSGVIAYDQTVVFEASSGTRHYGQRVQLRGVSLNFSSLPGAEMLYTLFGSLMLNGGKSDPVICILFPEDPSTFAFQAVYGNLEETGEIDHAYFGQMQSKSALVIKEQL